MYRFLYTKQKMYLRNSFCGTNHIDKSIYKYFVLKLIIVFVGANWALRSNCIGGGQTQYLAPYVQMA